MKAAVSERYLQDNLPQSLQALLLQCDIKLGGSRPWDVRVHDSRVYGMALRRDIKQLGEAYVRGEWDCDRIDQLIERLSNLSIEQGTSRVGLVLDLLSSTFRDGGSRRASQKVAKEHYNLGNDLFKAMLDPRMTYSCGYWANADTLAAAQEAKLDLICRKLRLDKGMRFLDIGGGWGSLAIYAAQNYGVEAVMTTVSQNQAEEAKARSAGLPVDARLEDYRDTTGQFDRIASVGMFEHVGKKHHQEYMKKARSLLAPDGLFLLHTIGSNVDAHSSNPWIEEWIFPGGHVPTPIDLAQAVEGHFVAEDWHNFGADYDKTLVAWCENFSRFWEKLRDQYPASFYRRWRLYLLACAGSFRARQLQLWQVVLSPSGVPGGYRRVS